MSLSLPAQLLLIAGLLFGTSGCFLREKADADAVAASCAGSCPAGTWRDEVRSSRSTQTAFVDFVEGSCSWSCVALAACPNDMVPVITADCFTCAKSIPGGTLAGGSCDPSDWFADRSDAPDGSVATSEIGGSSEREETVRFEGLRFLEAWDPGFQPRGLAAWGDTLYVGDFASGQIHHIDIETRNEVGATDIGSLNPTDLAASETTVWAADDGVYGFDLNTGALVAGLDAWEWEGAITYNGEHLIVIEDTQMIFYDPVDLSIRDEDRIETPLPGPAASGPRRLLSADVVSSPSRTWRVPITDLSGASPFPVDDTLTIELDAGPAHGLAVVGDRMFVTGAFEGSLNGQIIMLAIE